MELLIAIKDRSDNISDIKRGDVIEIKENGWCWSESELYNNNWIIIRSNIIQTLANVLRKSSNKESVINRKLYRD